MRLFTAIDISDDVRANLRAFIERLKPLAKLRWSPVENLHITTKFIGEWPEKRLDELKHALDNVCATATSTVGSMDIAIRGIGWFPNVRHPRVFWAGVEANDSLRSLAAATDSVTAGIGVPRETRPYAPHLTLARFREPLSVDALDALQKAIAKSVPERTSSARTSSERESGSGGFDFGSFRATAFFLYLSLGGRYTKLAEFPLSQRN